MRFRELYAPLRKCPQCGSHDVARSRERGLLEPILHRVFRLRPYRCRACSGRYFGYSHAVRHGEERRDAA